MAFTILNDPAAPVNPAGFGDQAEPDKVDFDIIAAAYNADFVVLNCAVTAQGTPDMTVAVASGSAVFAGVFTAITGGNATIGTADATNPRIDLIVATSGGSFSVVAGTANANPCMPNFTPTTQVVLAAVYVPANDTAIESNQITDKRVIMPRYAIKAGVAGGQAIYGDTAANGNLLLGGTSNATHTTSIISMLDHVRLASGKVIQDSGGATRITLATSTPEVALTGDAQVTQKLGVGTAPNSTRTLYVVETVTGTSGNIIGGEFALTYTPNAGSSIGYALFGGVVVNGIAGSTVTGARALDFAVTAAATSPSGNMTFTDVIGINVLPKASISVGGANTLTVTNLMGARFQIQAGRIVSGTCTVDNGVTLWVRQPNHAGTSAITNAIATRIEDYTTFSGTTPTLNYLLEVGGGQGATGTPTTTSGLFRVMGNFSAAANVTPVWISEGATPTLRQLKTKDGASITGGDLVCVLV